MTSFFPDVNVWLALTWSRHALGRIAHSWFEGIAKNQTRLVFCRITQLGLIRLLTNEQVMGESVVTVHQALKLYDRWLEDPRLEFAIEPPGLENLFRQAMGPSAAKPATKTIMDAYLTGFAEAEQATLVTMDKALGKLAQARRTPVLLLH